MQKCIEESNLFSVISDGTTDASVTEDEIVYLRHAKDGKTYLEFVAVTGVIIADSKSITDAILGALSEHLGITPEDMSRKMVGFGSDGANIMLGRNNGVSTRLEQLNPELQAVHCTAHRLELAFKDAMKKTPQCNNVNTLLLNLYLYYKNNSKNRSALREADKAVGAPIAIPTRVGGTTMHCKQVNSPMPWEYAGYHPRMYPLHIFQKIMNIMSAKCKVLSGRGPRALDGSSAVLDALSCYLNLILKHSDTKRDTKKFKKNSIQIEGGGGGGAPVAPPLGWIRYRC